MKVTSKNKPVIPSKKPYAQPVRVSAWQAALECGVSIAKMKSGLKANHILPGSDQKYSLRNIVDALTDHSGLAKQALEAKYRSQIDAAEYARLDRLEKRNQLAPVQKLKDWASDIFTQLVQFIRHSELEVKGQEQLISQLQATTFELQKIVPFTDPKANGQ